MRFFFLLYIAASRMVHVHYISCVLLVVIYIYFKKYKHVIFDIFLN